MALAVIRSRSLRVVILVATIAAVAGSAYAARRGPFEGAWEGIDVDGSNQWMWVTSYSGVHDILFYDDMCSSCTSVPGEGPACLGVASARLSDWNVLSMDGGVVTCLWLEPEVLLTDLTGSFVAKADGTLTDDYGNLWTKSHDRPERVIQPPPATPPPPKELVDVVLLVDTTGDNSALVANLKNSIVSVLSAVRAEYPDAAFAVATFNDFPYSTYGEPGDLPYLLAQPLTADEDLATSAILNTSVHGGGDSPESGTPALYALATGAGLSWPGGETPQASIGFRAGSLRIVVVITNAQFHNDYMGNNVYSFGTYGYFQAVSALAGIGARSTAVFAGTSTEGIGNLDAYAAATGAYVDPSAFGTTGLCNTGVGGSGRQPDSLGRCPLVFLVEPSGGGAGTAATQAILLAAGQ